MIKKFIRRLCALKVRAVALCLALACILAALGTVSDVLGGLRQSSMVITLNYRNARNGLTPSGGRFDISEIKDDKILMRAIELLGDGTLSAEELKKEITIGSKMPQSSVERVTSAISSGSDYSYCPSEFVISYKSGKFLPQSSAEEFLRALASAYKEYFTDAYADKNLILKFDKNSDDMEGYDYYEVYEILYDKIGSMLTYLNLHDEENSTFRSQSTGYSFANIITMLVNLRDVDLAKLEAYIVQNSITTNRASFIRKQEYSIEKKMLNYSKMRRSSDIKNDAQDLYNGHLIGIAFIPSVDNKNEFYMAKTKTGLDTLVTDSYTDGIAATNTLDLITRHRYMIGKFSAEEDTAQSVTAAADEMIADISEYLDTISEVAIQTDDDYLLLKTNDYITFLYSERSLMGYAFKFATHFVFWFVIAILLFCLGGPIVRRAAALWGNVKRAVKEAA